MFVKESGCLTILFIGAKQRQAQHDNSGNEERDGDGTGEPGEYIALCGNDRCAQICLHRVAEHIAEYDRCQRDLILAKHISEDTDCKENAAVKHTVVGGIGADDAHEQHDGIEIENRDEK